MMDWLPIFILLMILIVTFIPSSKSITVTKTEEPNERLPC